MVQTPRLPVTKGSRPGLFWEGGQSKLEVRLEGSRSVLQEQHSDSTVGIVGLLWWKEMKVLLLE